MTTEEKAKAYDEALERAKKLHKDAITLQLEQDIKDYEYIFPELAESEDERIRKEMLNVFKQLDEGTTICGRNYDYTKWIAWLEKQGDSGVAVQYYDPHSKRYTEYIRKDIAEGMVFTEQEENLKLKKVLSNFWKPADGDDLPEIDREVIALVEENEHYKVVFAHRPPEYWDGKNVLTGKVTRYTPKTYDKGNWNQPDVKWWLDIEVPKTKMEEEV